jgi:urea transport system substrate-binding protein
MVAGSARAQRPGLVALGLMVALLLSACVGSQQGTSQSGGGDSGEASQASDDVGQDQVPVGVLHSLSGTMAISETSVHDATLLAIEQINDNGGVLGKQLVPVVEDGASDWPTFAERAERLITQQNVAVTFGGWTSASRKAMLPVFEEHQELLFYPVQYEGMESSPYIFYTGAAPNQQIVPALEYLVTEEGVDELYLLGSDYVFPRTANQVIKAYAAEHDVEIVGEEYTPLGHTEYSTIITQIADAEPDAVFNTLNGDSNVAFFNQLSDASISAEDIPTLSVSVAEEQIRAIGPSTLEGHLVAWNYFMSTDTPANQQFVSDFRQKYGRDRVTTDPMEAGRNGVYLWAAAVEKAGTFEVEAVREAADGVSVDAPGGTVTIDGENQHIAKTARVGRVQADGQVQQLWSSDGPIEPDPFLQGYGWASGLSDKLLEDGEGS